MESMERFLDRFKQNRKLAIRMVSPGFGHLSSQVVSAFGPTHRNAHYFFLLMLQGSARHVIDLQPYDVGNNELLFILPNQIHELPKAKRGGDYFKIGFDENCLALLPRQYPFLVNPLNSQKIHLTPAAVARLKPIAEILLGLLSTMDGDPELIVAHLNSLLTEINTAYFAADKSPADSKLSKYIAFKVFVENNLTDHPKVEAIAEELALNPNSLYTIVKHYSGQSPKEFMTHRLILEARRRLYYGESTSVKELAFELGFSDPDYFSRLFKKVTGQTVAAFFQDLSSNE
ncbi:AraC family transcriptional regulator [Fulvivirgaceae bacterium PWU5]|uniref:AraC family transcriptional regulator n=2 Tax=Dawidia cretensis TaxID=2782350 RepID=A0AAP2DY61_9BACT|nr:AraC family transcriptional regulator [Dawidia cretensis]